jgi:signal transduction histidine kinase/ABC-type amino acid transport substrate-binding protein
MKLLFFVLAMLPVLCFGQGGAPAPDAVSASSVRLYEDRPFRIGIIELSSTDDMRRFVRESVNVLRNAFAPFQIDFQEYSSAELEEAVRTGRVDAFIASAGFYWRMQRYGVRDVATLISGDMPDPNHSISLAFITRAENDFIKTIPDLKGLRLSASYPTAFMGYRIGLAEIASLGFDPENFFRSVTFTFSPSLRPIADKVLSGEADAAFVHACWLEKLPAAERAKFRVIAPRSDPNYGCLHSTHTYPNITVAVLKSAAAGSAREIARLLLNMPANEEGFRWGLATDFQSVDSVYRLLKIENYSYLREWSVKRWIEAHRPWIAAAAFCLVLLILHSFVVSWLVRRRTAELARANEEKLAVTERLSSLQSRMEQIRKANLVSQLSSMIAHELAQPVGAAQSYSEGLKLLSESGELTAAQLKRSIGGIDRSLQRIASIVEKVRSYSRGAVNRDQKLNLLSIVKTARDSLPQRLRTAMAVSVSIDPALSVVGDELETELLFNNLISNAVTAALKTENPCAAVTAEAKGDAVRVVIENSGRRFTENDIQELTVPLISEKGPGHGLGVPIALSLAEANGGHLSYEAREPDGIRAVLTLRRAA